MSLVVIQGRELVKEYENAGNKFQFLLKNYKDSSFIGNIILRDFETKNEKTAYLQGLKDGEGWNENCFIEDEEAEEIIDLLTPSKVYVVRENFYQEEMPENYSFRIFAGTKSYERAMNFLTETANAHDSFLEFLDKNGDFREKNLFWEIEEQTLEMWSAESIDLIESIKDLGLYSKNNSKLNYTECDYGVTGYYFEKS